MCPIATVKSSDGSLKYDIHVELDSNADSSNVSSNELVVHDIECYIDVYGYDRISRHRNITTVDATVAYDNPDTQGTHQFCLLIKPFYVVFAHGMVMSRTLRSSLTCDVVPVITP